LTTLKIKEIKRKGKRIGHGFGPKARPAHLAY
jgi:hypothetical protein